MDIAQMMIFRKIDLIVRFPANGDFFFLRNNKAVVNVGALDNFESYDRLFGNLNLKLV